MQSLHFSRIPNFSKQLNFLQELFFQKMLFFWTATFLIANLSFTLSIDNLVINPKNTVVFRLKLPGGGQSAASLKKSFHYIPWTNIFHQIRFLRAVLNRNILKKTMQKKQQCKKIQFLAYLITTSISVLNHRENQQFMTYYSSL